MRPSLVIAFSLVLRQILMSKVQCQILLNVTWEESCEMFCRYTRLSNITRPSLYVIQNSQQYKKTKANPRITWGSMASIFPPLHCFVCFGFVGFLPPLSQIKIIKKSEFQFSSFLEFFFFLWKMRNRCIYLRETLNLS